MIIRESPVQVVLGINGNDCTVGNGNSAEELEAIAVGLLRAAQLVREQGFGAIEVRDRLMRVAVVPDLPEYDEVEPPILETFTVAGAESDTSRLFRQSADDLIESYRRIQILNH